jgi:hypothetical protein
MLASKLELHCNTVQCNVCRPSSDNRTPHFLHLRVAPRNIEGAGAAATSCTCARAPTTATAAHGRGEGAGFGSPLRQPDQPQQLLPCGVEIRQGQPLPGRSIDPCTAGDMSERAGVFVCV